MAADAGPLTSSRLDKVRRLAEEADGVLEDKSVDGFRTVAAPAHFQACFGNGQGIAVAPIAGAVHPEVASGVAFENVDRAGRRAFGFRVERDPAPEPGIKNHSDGVLLHVIDKDAARLDALGPDPVKAFI